MEENQVVILDADVAYEPPELITVEVPGQAEIFNICDSGCA